MIFVTVGTTHFDALSRSIDEAAGRGAIPPDTIIQIGHGGRYVPRHCRYFRVAPSLEPFERAADIIIGHGGTGTTLEILLMQKSLISVSNPDLAGNHQHEFLEALEALGLVTYCRNLAELPALIAAAPRSTALSTAPSRLAADLHRELMRMPRRADGPQRWWSRLARRLADRLARGVEIDVASTLRPASQPPLPADLLCDPHK